MNRRTFLASSPLFFASLALAAKTAGALPVGFPEEFRVIWATSHPYGQRVMMRIPRDLWNDFPEAKSLNMLG